MDIAAWYCNSALNIESLILLFEFLRQGDRAAAIRVVQIMELLLRVIVQRVHAIHVRREDDDLNLQIQNVILIVIPVHIGVPDAFIAEARFRQAELPLDVGIRGREKIVDAAISSMTFSSCRSQTNMSS